MPNTIPIERMTLKAKIECELTRAEDRKCEFRQLVPARRLSIFRGDMHGISYHALYPVSKWAQAIESPCVDVALATTGSQVQSLVNQKNLVLPCI